MRPASNPRVRRKDQRGEGWPRGRKRTPREPVTTYGRGQRDRDWRASMNVMIAAMRKAKTQG